MLRDLLILMDTHHQIISQSFGLSQGIRVPEMHHVVAVINNIAFFIYLILKARLKDLEVYILITSNYIQR